MVVLWRRRSTSCEVAVDDRRGALLHTMRWMCDELIAGAPELEARTKVYALELCKAAEGRPGEFRMPRLT